MIDELRVAIERLLAGEDLDASTMRQAIAAVMDGRCSEAEIAALLTALRMKGESVAELEGAALAMIERAAPISCRRTGLLDTCGTGGDGQHTFNISTAAALVAAAAGVPVAKHGNRRASSASGSADVLEELGVNVQLPPEAVARCIDELGIGFCFAQVVHGAMKHAAPVRRQLGFRTIFNLLGPLTNPARAEYQLIGTGRPEIAATLAHAVARLGRTRVIVVCGGDGSLDEVSLWGETLVYRVEGGDVTEAVWTAETFGLPPCRIEDLRVASAVESAAVLRRVFAGEAGPPRDMVLANAAAALLAVGQTEDLTAAVATSADAIDTGRAADLCRRLAERTNALAEA